MAGFDPFYDLRYSYVSDLGPQGKQSKVSIMIHIVWSDDDNDDYDDDDDNDVDDVDDDDNDVDLFEPKQTLNKLNFALLCVTKKTLLVVDAIKPFWRKSRKSSFPPKLEQE